MDTSVSVSGERTRTVEEAMGTGTTADRNMGKRPRGGALEIALAVDLEVEKEHAQWRTLELKPQVEARRSSVVEGVGGAASA